MNELERTKQKREKGCEGESRKGTGSQRLDLGWEGDSDF